MMDGEDMRLLPQKAIHNTVRARHDFANLWVGKLGDDPP